MSTTFLLLIAILCIATFLQTESQVLFDAHQNSLKTYIIHVKKSELVASDSLSDLESYYNSFLSMTARGASNANQRLVYSYQHVASGFAARLTEEEVKAMEGKGGFLAAVPDRLLPLHTTHTPSFLGLNQNFGFVNGSNFGNGVIIGLLDTGILPTHPSFDDHDMPPPPAKWKGKCEFSSCNNKLIGARNFDSSSKPDPPTDDEGHGTHTASTAGGNFVKGANVFGNANGTATGMAPRAHIAMYKVCGALGCYDSDILAAMDAAVADGVDILSLSLGGPSGPFYSDSTAVGAFGAIQKGVLVSCSAANSGPNSSSLSNEAPWILTVGASTIDRKIKATVKLGNGNEFDGESLFQPRDFPSTLLPLVYAGQNGNTSSALCAPGSLGDEVKGKVVLCERGGDIARIEKGQAVKDAGGAAMILMNEEADGYSTLADFHVLPATHLSYAAGLLIMAYINSTSTPTATLLFEGTVIGDATAPMVASFSSRGPSLASPGILKPDIIGPGVSILAAWPFPLDNSTTSKATFNMISGTSMSCPHLSGIAALLKSAHPNWSPAAIKSAIMTTANIVNLGNKPIYDERLLQADFFAIGAGHVNPSKANDPGLIYDLKPDDYLPYLCGLGYKNEQVSAIAHKTIDCSQIAAIPEAQLNYPSFAITLKSNDGDTVNYTRTVTNVGNANSFYDIGYVAPEGVDVSLVVQGIQFSALGQTQTFSVKFTKNGAPANSTYAQGYLELVSDDKKYTVRSPISVKFV